MRRLFAVLLAATSIAACDKLKSASGSDAAAGDADSTAATDSGGSSGGSTVSLPGVVAGCFLVFIPAVGEFVIPDLLGGSETLMIGKTLYNEFFLNRDWPVSSAIAVLLLLVLVVPIAIYNNVQAKELGGKA